MPGEGLTLISHDGIARKLRKLLRELEALLRQEDKDARSIHQLRRHTKKLRAWLALLDPEGASRKLRKAEQQLCSLAQAYGQQRDARVLLDTLESLTDPAQVPACHQLLLAHLQNAMNTLPAAQHADDPKLQRALQVLADTTATGFDERSLRAGLRHGYRRARSLYGKALESGEHEHFHRLRRWVKHLAAQMELVVLCRSGGSRTQLKALTELGSTLGKFHDIDVFREHLELLEAEHGSMPGLAGEIAMLHEHARAAETTLLEKALPMAEQCLAEKPKRFAAAKAGS